MSRTSTFSELGSLGVEGFKSWFSSRVASVKVLYNQYQQHKVTWSDTVMRFILYHWFLSDHQQNLGCYVKLLKLKVHLVLLMDMCT